MIINYNGRLLQAQKEIITANNRAFKYADSLFETIKVRDAKICFLEDHYFRLMASMRILRMEIPHNFTLAFFEQEIVKTIAELKSPLVRVRITVFRTEGGLYKPTSNEISYIIEASVLKQEEKKEYVIDVFKDFYVYSGFLSTLKTTSKQINILGAIFADENGYDNCLLLNERKNVVEATNGNIFVVKDHIIKTPPITEGCIKGIVRKKMISIISKNPNYTLKEVKISPFELQKANEVFITNAIVGIQPVTQYKKTKFTTKITNELQQELQGLYS